MRANQEEGTMSLESSMANWGLRLPVMKEIQIVKPTRIDGTPYKIGDVVSVSARDAFCLVACGKATSYPLPQTKEESLEDLAKRRKEALNSGPYKVEITRPCMVKGFPCEPGEIIAVDEDNAMCLTICVRGKIIGRPAEKEDIEMKVSRMIEEKLCNVSGNRQ